MYISLVLTGMFQSYSVHSRHKCIKTENFPTRSAITGMICNSLNRFGKQEEFLNELASCVKIDVFSYKNVKTLRDFQTIGSYNLHTFLHNITKKTDCKTFTCCAVNGKIVKDGQNTAIVDKDYLIDAEFGVILYSDNEKIMEEINNGFEKPLSPLFLGRKSCQPYRKIHVGMFKKYDDALDSINNIFRKKPIFIISESKIEGFNEINILNDIPISFDKMKEYTSRRVYKKCLI